jgi:toxin CcdB
MAAQFDVFANPDKQSSATHPYFVVLQTNSLDRLNTRIVAPLVEPKSLATFDRLFPEVIVRGTKLVVDVTNIGVVPAKMLTQPILNLETERQRIIAAIDLVFTGI